MPGFLRSASVMDDILRWATSVGTIGAGLIAQHSGGPCLAIEKI
jgi:hypothetical protein